MGRRPHKPRRHVLLVPRGTRGSLPALPLGLLCIARPDPTTGLIDRVSGEHVAAQSSKGQESFQYVYRQVARQRPAFQQRQNQQAVFEPDVVATRTFPNRSLWQGRGHFTKEGAKLS